MFIPVAGAALGMFILFDTGVALGAIAATQGYPVWVGLASLVVTPVFWLEFAVLFNRHGREHLAVPQINAAALA